MEYEKQIHLSKLSYALLSRLTELHYRFKNKGELQTDGSFFQSSEQLASWLHCSIGGLRYARNCLIKVGRIHFIPISVRGKAAMYFVVGLSIEKKKKKTEQIFKRFEGTK